MRSRTAAITEGVASGLLAVLAMTVVMEAGRRTGGFEIQPPKRIVRTVLRGQPKHRVRRENVLTALAHGGYGLAAGGGFGLLTRAQPEPSRTTGMVYGLALWVAGYEGWVPTLGAMPPIHRDRLSRSAALAAGHLVYGAVLTQVIGRLRRGRSSDISPAS